MIDYFVRMWMREGGAMNRWVVSLTPTLAPIIPANPMRFCLILPNPASQSNEFAFLDSVEPVVESLFRLNSGFTTLILDRDVIGDQMCRQLWGANPAATGPQEICEFIFNPEKYHTYKRMIHDWVSHGFPS